MNRSAASRFMAAASCGALVLTMTGTAAGSDYAHTEVVSEDAVNWTPDLVPQEGAPKPVAYSIAEAGDQMVVGGRFTLVKSNSDRDPDDSEYPRWNVFAFDATDGTIHAGFDPHVDGNVWSVLSDGSSVYIGGNFTTVNGTSRAALAKLSLATGELDPDFRPTFTGGRVSDMAFHDGHLIVSGTFKKKLVALSPATGKQSSYTLPAVAGKLPNSDSSQVFKFDISPDGENLVGVGNFETVASVSRPRVFMLNLGATGATLSEWNYPPLGENCTSTRRNAIAYVQDVDFAPDSSYFALAAFGYMYKDGRRWYQICDSVSRFETDVLHPVQPKWINYTGGDSLKSVAVTGAAVYVQGHSRWLDSPYGKDSADEFAVDRPGGGAVDPDGVGKARPDDHKAVPGKALDWNPSMPQQSGGYQILPTQAGVWFVTDGTRWGVYDENKNEYRYEKHVGIRFAPLL